MNYYVNYTLKMPINLTEEAGLSREPSAIHGKYCIIPNLV